MTKYLLNSAVITTPGVYEYHVSYPSAEASGLPASSTRFGVHRREFPAHRRYSKEFLALALKAFAPAEPPEKTSVNSGGDFIGE